MCLNFAETDPFDQEFNHCVGVPLPITPDGHRDGILSQTLSVSSCVYFNYYHKMGSVPIQGSCLVRLNELEGNGLKYPVLWPG
jgi:hypothetical protein